MTQWKARMHCFDDALVLIKGAGDLASGVAMRLYKCGFPIVMTELKRPTMVRRAVSFAEAVYDGEFTVEGITARLVKDPDAAREALRDEVIPILIDPSAASVSSLEPAVLVDAIMAKQNTGTSMQDAPLVIALGPGFTAGVDCHAVIETNRGHWLGRVLWTGSAEADTRVPGTISGRKETRVLRSPADGTIELLTDVGALVTKDQTLAIVSGLPVLAPFDGALRGIIHTGLVVQADLKIGDVDPRGDLAYCYAISEKSLAIGGAVLEAILTRAERRFLDPHAYRAAP